MLGFLIIYHTDMCEFCQLYIQCIMILTYLSFCRNVGITVPQGGKDVVYAICEQPV